MAAFSLYMANGRILALDYGTVKVGLAMTDPLQITAVPFDTIRYHTHEDLLSKIRQIIEEYEIREILIGIPYTLDGGESQFTKKVLAFSSWMKTQMTLPVSLYDERLTSQEAIQSLIQMGVKTGHNKERIDSMAAAHLLRDYLDIRAGESSS